MLNVTLEKWGCDFRTDDYEFLKASDIGNYRVQTADPVKIKDGRLMDFEFSLGYDYCERKPNGTIDRKRKKKVPTTYLWMDTYYEDERGGWRDLDIEKPINTRRFTYTKASIERILTDLTSEDCTVTLKEVR